MRQPGGLFIYDVKGVQAPLAAAEAFSYGANALIRSDAAGLKPLAQMLEFLRGVAPDDSPAIADIGFQDDGTADRARSHEHDGQRATCCFGRSARPIEH